MDMTDECPKGRNSCLMLKLCENPISFWSDSIKNKPQAFPKPLVLYLPHARRDASATSVPRSEARRQGARARRSSNSATAPRLSTRARSRPRVSGPRLVAEPPFAPSLLAPLRAWGPSYGPEPVAGASRFRAPDPPSVASVNAGRLAAGPAPRPPAPSSVSLAGRKPVGREPRCGCARNRGCRSPSDATLNLHSSTPCAPRCFLWAAAAMVVSAVAHPPFESVKRERTGWARQHRSTAKPKTMTMSSTSWPVIQYLLVSVWSSVSEERWNKITWGNISSLKWQFLLDKATSSFHFKLGRLWQTQRLAPWLWKGAFWLLRISDYCQQNIKFTWLQRGSCREMFALLFLLRTTAEKGFAICTWTDEIPN